MREAEADEGVKVPLSIAPLAWNRAKTGMLAEGGFELLQYVVAESEKLLGSGMVNLSLEMPISCRGQ